MGVRPADSRVPDSEMATLMETPGAYAQGYLLTTNYRAILDYNCSNYYALTIGLLADAISRRG
jgi:membrane-bound lytic murein transglycosylase B